MRILTSIAIPAGAYVLWATYPSLPQEQVLVGVLALVALSLVVVRSWFVGSKGAAREDGQKE